MNIFAHIGLVIGGAIGVCGGGYIISITPPEHFWKVIGAIVLFAIVANVVNFKILFKRGKNDV